MALPDQNRVPGDEAWWAQFEEYVDRTIENGPDCQRVHPIVRNWLVSTLEELPSFDPLESEKIVTRYSELRKKFPPGSSISPDKRMKIALLAGRELQGANADKDHKGLRQAMACLATEVQLVEFGATPSENNITELAEHIIDSEQNVSLPLGVIGVGWLFEKSLQNGEFDDL